MKNEKKEQVNMEICHLRKGFEALTIDHKKGVLKTARGLLRVQRVSKTIVEDNTQYVFPKYKNGNDILKPNKERFRNEDMANA